MSEFEELARSRKVAKLVEQLDRMTLAAKENPFDVAIALKTAAFVRAMTPEQRLALCAAAKVQTKKPPSDKTWEQLAKRFEARSNEDTDWDGNVRELDDYTGTSEPGPEYDDWSDDDYPF